ncbi:IS21 family transposase [Elizabethkingia anophelis]|uniref:IS21 family transposase n=1 Tax=Elizabethkingia anophelis TaxID=1117645 RepID=UPI001EE6A0FD|nr:IS21 family transposase [Elizabethkingia anophelis]UKY81810.1 IS21 family transposase [Elizabethkingia anophelis]UKY82651.1 IS21 family transposase [Elizabethkingia anophelis]UKY84530.1 IS21 family transposase [Elizabethkingia anophelis]UKY84823.1 IS21 family transposase [Elizabethkingia anophelis]UKY84830.1 IS21 family transposase [Elizabethkingia anophelis]
MANTLDPMDIKQILTLHLDGYSNRQIASTLGISRNTVNSYFKRIKAGDLDPKLLVKWEHSKLNELFTQKSTIDSDRQERLIKYFKVMNEARNHPGFTFQFHYHQYFEQTLNPYSYTQFLEHYRRKYQKIRGSMKLEHEPGKEMFVDFAGTKLKIIDRTTGEEIAVDVFIAILPNSQYTFVQACRSQKKEDFILCCENALHFYSGVPKAIVSDNLKSAVNRTNRHEPTINRTFKDFADHYGCVINPTRTYSPQDKALVENAVHLTYQRIYYPMREMQFFSLAELNQEIKNRLTEYNKLLFQRKEASRLELFISVEQQYLKPLASSRYELKEYCRAKVQKMGYVYFSPDKSYYSVPYRFIGKSTSIHYTHSKIEVYYNYERIALHKRNLCKGHYNTQKEHLSSTHQDYQDWSPEYFKKIAKKHGPNVVLCVEELLKNQDYPEIGYKRIMGVLHLSKSYGSERLNQACRRAIDLEMVSYARIKNILQNNLDSPSLFFSEPSSSESHIPKHKNIRGASAYQ